MSKVTRELRDDKGRLLGTVSVEEGQEAPALVPPIRRNVNDPPPRPGAPHGDLVEPEATIETLAELATLTAHWLLKIAALEPDDDERSMAVQSARATIAYAQRCDLSVRVCPTCGTDEPTTSPTHRRRCSGG